jgi:hypothetical protein
MADPEALCFGHESNFDSDGQAAELRPAQPITVTVRRGIMMSPLRGTKAAPGPGHRRASGDLDTEQYSLLRLGRRSQAR